MIDIIIPTLKKLPELKQMIEDIERTAILEHHIIATCQPVSASKNRNFGLECSSSDIIIMLDDDITGFSTGWDSILIEPLASHKDIIMVSARCLNIDGTMASVGHCSYSLTPDLIYIQKLKEGILPSSAIAFRKTPVRFDENIVGAGFDDADFCFELYKAYPGCKFAVNNLCKLIHLNTRKGYGGRKEYGTENKAEEANLLKNRAYFYRKHYSKEGAEFQKKYHLNPDHQR